MPTAGSTPRVAVGVFRVYADGRPYAEGGRRRIGYAVTAPVRRELPGHVSRHYADGLGTPRVAVGVLSPTPTALLRRRLRWRVSWIPSTPTAPIFGGRRRGRPSATLPIPVVLLPAVFSGASLLQAVRRMQARRRQHRCCKPSGDCCS
jgi:hypothetical protein